MSEPGRLTHESADLYLAAYPPDGVLFPPKQCTTCDLGRPGRSKHCNACGSCIIRFDHHCGWLNNCIGLYNARHFLAFLAGNFLLCCYALWAAAAATAGSLQQRGFFDVYVYDPALQDRVALHSRPTWFIEWVLVYYPIQVALIMFSAITGLLLLAFLLYQSYLVSVGRTTYETLKRNQLLKDAVAAAAAAAVTAAPAATQQNGSDNSNEGGHRTAGGEREQQQHVGSSNADGRSSSNSRRAAGKHAAAAVGKDSGSNSSAGTNSAATGWSSRLFGWQQQQQQQQQQCVINYYDRGFWGNWCEVLWPETFLEQYRQQLAAAEPAPAPAAAAAAAGSDLQQKQHKKHDCDSLDAAFLELYRQQLSAAGGGLHEIWHKKDA